MKGFYLFANLLSLFVLTVVASGVPPQDMLARPPQDMLVAAICECPVGGACICTTCTCKGCACQNCPGKHKQPFITETEYGPFDTPPWATAGGGWKKHVPSGYFYSASTGWYYHPATGFYHPQQLAFQLSTVPMQGMMLGGCAGGG